MEIYEPFLSDGFVSLNSESALSTPIKILRDTGASQSLILTDTLPLSEETSTGTSVLIQGVECGFVNVPLHNIYLSSDLVTGLVAVGIRSKKISNDQELIQSDPISCSQNQKGNN